MCKIWENKNSIDISVEQLKLGLQDELFSEVESIGFNGGEPTLRRDLPAVVQVVVDTLVNLKAVSIITNAFKYAQVIDQIEKIGNIVKGKNISLDVMVSLDGFEGVHDRVRGREGNFRNALNVINYLKSSPLVDRVRIGCTVIRENVNHLPDLLDFCNRNQLYIKYRLGVPHQRLYTNNLELPYALTFEEKYEFVEFLEGLIEHYEPDPMQRFFYRSLADQIIKGAPRKAGCAWQHKGATITAKGELAYCAIKSNVLNENIAYGNNMAAYFQNEPHLRAIIKNDCDSCHHDYVGVPGKSDYLKLFLQRLDKKFGVISALKKLPGFSFLNLIRKRGRFTRDLAFFNSLEKRIKVVACEGSDKPNVKVLICGWYGTETLGDKAIIGGIIDVLREKFGVNVAFTVASLNTYVTEMTRKQMKEFYNVSIMDIKEAVSAVYGMDYLVFGGGPLMAINALAPMQVLFERAQASGVFTIACGVGVGPLGAPWLNHSISKILNLSNVRVYRDEKSKSNAIKLGVSAKNDLVGEDPAFTWLSKISGIDFSESKSLQNKKVLLLGLRDFPYKEYARGVSEREALLIKDNYEQTVVEALKKLVEADEDLIIKPLPMCTNHFGGDDRWFYRKLFLQCGELKRFLDLSLLGPEMSPLEYASEFHNADALLAMRFHSLVFGLGLGVNCVAIDYTMGNGKVKSLADKHNVTLLGMRDLNVDSLFIGLKMALEAQRPSRMNSESLSFKSCLYKSMDECMG